MYLTNFKKKASSCSLVFVEDHTGVRHRGKSLGAGSPCWVNSSQLGQSCPILPICSGLLVLFRDAALCAVFVECSPFFQQCANRGAFFLKYFRAMFSFSLHVFGPFFGNLLLRPFRQDFFCNPKEQARLFCFCNPETDQGLPRFFLCSPRFLSASCPPRTFFLQPPSPLRPPFRPFCPPTLSHPHLSHPSPPFPPFPPPPFPPSLCLSHRPPAFPTVPPPFPPSPRLSHRPPLSK